MSTPAHRPHLRTAHLRALRAKSQARRQEVADFFDQHLLDVVDRLNRATQPYETKLAALRKVRLQAAHDKELDETAGYRLGTAGRKPQLWQVERDGCGQ